VKRILLVFAAVIAFCATASAQLYIVNGEEYSAEQMRRIDPERVEHSEQVAVNDSIMARYGERAADGVIVVTLKHDTEPQFSVDSLSFREWVEREVAWGDDEPAARVVYRYVLDELVERLPDAFTELSEVMRRVVPVVLLLLVRAVPVVPLLRVAVPTPEVLPRRVEADVPVRAVVEAERLPVAALRDDPVRVGTLDVTAVRRFSSESVLTTHLLASREGILT
jgi:hypothetical protein